MNLIREIAGELASMFAGDGSLSFQILALVAVAAVIAAWSGLDPLVGGAILLFGSIAILIGSVWRAASP